MDSTTPPPDAGQLPDARDEASSPAIPAPTQSPAPAAPPPMNNAPDGNGEQFYQQQDNTQNQAPQYGGGSVAPMHDRQQYSDQQGDRGNYNRNQQNGRGQGQGGGNRNNGRRGRHNQRGRGRPNQNQNQGGDNRQVYYRMARRMQKRSFPCRLQAPAA